MSTANSVPSYGRRTNPGRRPWDGVRDGRRTDRGARRARLGSAPGAVLRLAVLLIPRASAETAARLRYSPITMRPWGSTSRIGIGRCFKQQRETLAGDCEVARRSFALHQIGAQAFRFASLGKIGQHRKPPTEADDRRSPDADGNAGAVFADSYGLHPVMRGSRAPSGAGCSASGGRAGSNLPNTSCSFQPNRRSALSFQRMTRSSASRAIMASGDALMMASSIVANHFILDLID